MNELMERLMEISDPAYAEFQRKLIFTDRMILGVRAPVLRKMAGNLTEKEKEELFTSFPHASLEEDLLCGYVIGIEKDKDKCVRFLEALLPYMDNWAVCDQCKPNVLLKDRELTKKKAAAYLMSEHPFVVRYGVRLFMWCLDKNNEDIHVVSGVREDHHYILMAKAWYLAEAMVFHEGKVLAMLEGNISDALRAMTVRKCLDSRRVNNAVKIRLRRA